MDRVRRTSLADRAGTAAFLWPFLVGCALRLWQLPRQVLVDDEWHMVHALRDGSSLVGILSDFGANDHSIGLSLCNWLLMQMVTLDELLLRLPSIVAGLVLLGWFPILIAPRVGRRAAICLAWLMAVSPLLCFFTRLARPYAVTTLLVGLATLAMEAWVRSAGTSRRAQWTYLTCAVAAPIFHLPALPAVLAPFALTLLRRTVPPRRVVGLLALTLLAIGALLTIPFIGSGRGVLARVNADHVPTTAIPEIVELLAGTARPIGVVVVALFGLIGLVAAWRRSRTLTAYWAIVIAAQVAAVALSGATAVHTPIVAARYMAVVLPLLLLFPALGLARAIEAAGTAGIRLAPTVAGATAALALGSAGPLPWIYRSPNDFTNHISYQADYLAGRYFERFRPHTVSEFYTRTLASLPADSIRIVEAPWYFYFHTLAYTQRIHRQRVLVGFVSRPAEAIRGGEIREDDPGIRLRNAVSLDDVDAIRRRGVRFVVLHRDPTSEVRWPTGVSQDPIDMTGWIDRYRALGPPVFEDDQLVAFDLLALPPSANASD